MTEILLVYYTETTDNRLRTLGGKQAPKWVRKSNKITNEQPMVLTRLIFIYPGELRCSETANWQHVRDTLAYEVDQINIGYQLVGLVGARGSADRKKCTWSAMYKPIQAATLITMKVAETIAGRGPRAASAVAISASCDGLGHGIWIRWIVTSCECPPKPVFRHDSTKFPIG